MYTLIFRGKSFEIDKKTFLEWIASFLEGYHGIVAQYQESHDAGFGDLFQNFIPPRNGYPDNMAKMVSQISDRYLTDLYSRALKQVDSMISLDTEIVNWLAGYVKIPSLANKKDWQLLRRRINRIIVGGSNGTVQGSIWVLTEEYQSLLIRSRNIYKSFMDTYTEAQVRINELKEAIE